MCFNNSPNWIEVSTASGKHSKGIRLPKRYVWDLQLPKSKSKRPGKTRDTLPLTKKHFQLNSACLILHVLMPYFTSTVQIPKAYIKIEIPPKKFGIYIFPQQKNQENDVPARGILLPKRFVWDFHQRRPVRYQLEMNKKHFQLNMPSCIYSTDDHGLNRIRESTKKCFGIYIFPKLQNQEKYIS